MEAQLPTATPSSGAHPKQASFPLLLCFPTTLPEASWDPGFLRSPPKSTLCPQTLSELASEGIQLDGAETLKAL